MDTRKLGAEVLGTFWLVLGGCGAAVLASGFSPTTNLGIGFVGVSLAFGLTVLTGAYALGHISGGHFNPAVSLGLATALKFPAQEVIPYWIAQLVGGIVAVLAVSVVYSGQAVERSSPRPASVSRTEAHSCSS
jgi:aquaporin Z